MQVLKELGKNIQKQYLQEFSEIFLATLPKEKTNMLDCLLQMPTRERKTKAMELTDALVNSFADGTAKQNIKNKLKHWLEQRPCMNLPLNINPEDFNDIYHAEKTAFITIIPRIYPETGKAFQMVKEVENFYHYVQKITFEAIQCSTLSETRKNNQRLNEAQKIARLGNWKYDLGKKLLTWSENMYALHGIEPGYDIQKNHALEFVHPEDRSFVVNMIKEAILGCEEIDFHYRCNIKGKTKFFHLRGKIICDENKAHKIFGTAQDVTDKMELVISLRKNEEELSRVNNELEYKVKERTRELQAYAEKFRVLLDAMPQLAWTESPDRRVMYMNSQLLRLTGKRNFKDFETQDYLYPADRHDLNTAWEKARANKLPFNIKYRLKREDNTYRWYLGNYVPLKSDKGKVYLWICTATEIHEQEISSLKKDEFISIASHELKTPLTNIKAYVQLLEKKIQDPGTRNFAEKAGQHVEKLSVLISDLLDISKIQAGHLVLNINEFSISKLVNESIESFYLSNPDYTIVKKGNFDYKVKADRRRVEQVLNNFISNAIKYSPKNKEILIESYVEDHQANIAVVDQGMGIPEDKLEKVFDRYYRVDPQEKFIKGMGLGLFIAKEIIRLHNGRIWAWSSNGKGSTFYFTLPLAQPIQKSTSQKLYFTP